eukprot:gene13996-21449_t
MWCSDLDGANTDKTNYKDLSVLRVPQVLLRGLRMASAQVHKSPI